MIGKRPTQKPLFDVGNVFDLKLNPKSFHAQLALAAPRLFQDQDFAAFYKDKQGRPSVPPSLLALATLLQQESGVSDEEAINRTAYDLRWVAVLGREAGQPLCAKSTFQLFRAHLVLHPEVNTIFQASLKEAKRTGLLKGEALKIALDTKPIRGRGAVQDTFNLLASGIRQLGRVLAQQEDKKPNDFFAEQDLDRYTHDSVKGSADLDWSDDAAKNALLTQIVQDAKRLLALATSSLPCVREAASLLEQLLLQDVEVKKTDKGEQAHIKEGTAKGRMPSATDPDVRHGRKSASKRFNGHKADVAVDQDSQLIVAFDVIAGDAGDASGALSLVEQAEENTGLTVIQTSADCAYGGGPTRSEFAEAGRELLAKVPKEVSRNGMFVKSDFELDLENDRVTCPAGKTTTTFSTSKEGFKTFTFGCACADCPLRSACTTSQSGRSISVHPQEGRLREARAYQKTPDGKARLRQRVVVEHRLARLGQLGIGQARYRSRVKTRFQLMVAASLANFRLIWNQEAGRGPDPGSSVPLLPVSGALRDCWGLLLALFCHFLPVQTVRAMTRQQFHFAQRAAA
jgi:Transposase DDE domain/Transposase domain (DUF772)